MRVTGYSTLQMTFANVFRHMTFERSKVTPWSQLFNKKNCLLMVIFFLNAMLKGVLIEKDDHCRVLIFVAWHCKIERSLQAVPSFVSFHKELYQTLQMTKSFIEM